MAESDAAGDPAHLPAELIVVEGVGGDLGDDERNDKETQDQCEANDRAEVERQACKKLKPLPNEPDKGRAVGVQHRDFKSGPDREGLFSGC